MKTETIDTPIQEATVYALVIAYTGRGSNREHLKLEPEGKSFLQLTAGKESHVRVVCHGLDILLRDAKPARSCTSCGTAYSIERQNANRIRVYGDRKN